MRLEEGISELAGNVPLTPAAANQPFDDNACEFLADMSAALRADPACKTRADLMAFAFWCRNARLAAMKERFTDTLDRLGCGLAFHIAPGNVPINGLYSFAFGLLSGNSNIVRLTSREDISLDLALGHIRSLLENNKYHQLSQRNALIRYERGHMATTAFSERCDVRIIWGGDDAIRDIRKAPIGPRTREITFADRYSFCVMDSKALSEAPDKTIERLAVGFFNDTLQMDQNACSSPHLIVWLNGGDGTGKERFRQALETYTKARYTLEPVQAVDRYTQLLSGFIDGPQQELLSERDASIQWVQLEALQTNTEQLRGQYGLFYEFDAEDLSKLAHIVNKKYQTLTYWGLEKDRLRDFVIQNNLSGVDRIVPIGDALNIDVIWDGHDVLKEMTRIIDVRP